MGMQTDVRALEKTSSGTIFSGRTRVKAIAISYASGGTVTIKDGGASGTTVWSFTAPAAAGSISILLDRKSTRLNSSHSQQSRMPSSA